MGLSATDKYKRLKKVSEWIAEGHSWDRLHDLIFDEYDLISYKARNKLIKEVLNEMYDEFDKEAFRKSHTKYLQHIFDTAMKKGELNVAINAIDKANKLIGLYTEVHEHKVVDHVKIKFGE